MNSQSNEDLCLKCTNLTIGFKNPGIAKNISFEIHKGDFICIVGENGAGKSTLIKTILSLLKPLEGKLEWGKEFGRHTLGYLPQQTDFQKDFPATVHEVVLSGCQSSMRFIPFYKKEHKALALEKMTLLGITDIAKKSFRELSGGQRQRVLLARSLCAAKNLLIMDEPVSGLDPQITEELYSLVYSLNKQGMTIIQITHDLSSLEYATHVLKAGKEFKLYTKEEFVLGQNLNSREEK